MKITKKLIKEILRLENLTLQDIDVLKNFVTQGFHNRSYDKLFFKALKLYNITQEG